MKIKVIKNINELITLEGTHQKDGRRLELDDLSIIKDGSIVFNEKEILWLGETKELPEKYQNQAQDPNIEAEDGTGSILMPEVVDSHTHLIFAGNRSDEYLARLNGADYEEIAKMGGGILSTARSTNDISIENLLEICRKRIRKINSYGIGHIEIKSGYGLNYQKEKELSLAIHQLKEEFAPHIGITNTFMAAHAIPKGSNANDYINQIVLPLMEELNDIIDIVDIFHEKNYFETSHTKQVLEKAKSLGLNTKTHADEFNDNDGAALAANFQALSCDHLLQISEKGIQELANPNSKCVATLLPGTAFFLGKNLAPARKLLDAGAKVAVASDYNPGSNHWDNLLQIAKMSAPSLGVNPAELIAAITYNAAHSLGLKNQGYLSIGAKPRFTKLNYSSLAEFLYTW